MVALWVLNAEKVEAKVVEDLFPRALRQAWGGMLSVAEAMPDARGFLCKDTKEHIRTLKRLSHVSEHERVDTHLRDIVLILHRHFHFDKLAKWRALLTAWVSTLVCNLRDEVHEGAPLSFWFVCGDQSEVEDSPRFRLEQTSEEALESLSPWKGEHDNVTAAPDLFKERVRLAAQVASRENYAWFHGGMYAVFWDVSFPASRPAGLLAIRGGYTWESYVQDRLNNRAGSGWPALIVGYVRPDKSAGMLIGDHSVLSLHQHVERKETVVDWLKELKEPYIRRDGELVPEADLLCRLCVQIADKPHVGCTLAFMNSGARPDETFMKMGYEWALEPELKIEKERTDEIVSLMTMDGGTCVWQAQDGGWKLGCRYLLSGPAWPSNMAQGGANKSDLLDQIRKTIKTKDEPSLLRGAGTRRWSGAMCACREDVDMVIVASQDGDIYCFDRCEGPRLRIRLLQKSEEEVRYSELIPGS